MTPFKIRNRPKSLFGIKEPTTNDDPLPKFAVTYRLPNGETYEVTATKGDTLVLASGRSSWPIDTGCADSSCATCQVDVLAGADALTKTSDGEKDTLSKNGASPERRLGCRAKVMGPGVVVGMVNVMGSIGPATPTPPPP